MPLCPHCDKAVTLDESNKMNTNELQKEVDGLIKKEVMYSCPHCDKVLGFAFFFGGLATGRP